MNVIDHFLTKLLLVLFLILAGLTLFLLFYTTETTPPEPDKPPVIDDPSTTGSPKTGLLLYNVGLSNVPIANVSYTLPVDQTSKQAKTTLQGEFLFEDGQIITFDLFGKQYAVIAKEKITLPDLIPENENQQNNLALLLRNQDNDRKLNNGIFLEDSTQTMSTPDLALPEEAFVSSLYASTGIYPKPRHAPSLGINVESAQAEADTVGQAIPFADVFRTARPFTELSGTHVKFDQHGWPVNIPKGETARTKLFQGTHQGAIPDGIYTVIYEGEGIIFFSGGALKKQKRIGENAFELSIETQNADKDAEANSLNIVIAETNPQNPVKNIQVIMPGGICRDQHKQMIDPIDTVNAKDNPFVRVEKQASCPNGTQYVSFKALLAPNRNFIAFNPDYLQHLRPFQVLRLMNLMEASPSFPCRSLEDEAYQTCLMAEIKWQARARMEDAAWGGSARTPHEYHKGIPVEVLAALTNQLDINPWFTLPHYADDEYVSEFATYMAKNLNQNLQVYIEYSNETWNPGFWGHYYTQQKGLEEKLDQVPTLYGSDPNRDSHYFARLRYYTQRSLDIFTLWQQAFTDNHRPVENIVEVLGTQQGDIILTEEMLKYNDASDQVDAIAMAPYFFGCIDRNIPICQQAEHVLSEVENIDDIFNILQTDYEPPYKGDPSAIEGTMAKVRRQAEVTSQYGVELITYEGGQHLTIMGSMGDLPQEEKIRLRGLFKQANRDPRMKEAYLSLLEHWYDMHKEYGNVGLFTLYTSAQSFYDYGNWGIQEYLNQPREDAPKYDAIMSFQEKIGVCWWNTCNTTLTQPETE
jgi:hypothetical protein